MENVDSVFGQGCKVVISPDKMRAWISLTKPAKGVRYTADAVRAWLPQNGVVHGVDDGMIRKALDSERYDDLLEVARGEQPVPAKGGRYSLRIEKKPFTGLSLGMGGSLIYDDLSFLQEAVEGQILADIIPPEPPQDGMTVTGEVIVPRDGDRGETLNGTGFAISEDGRHYIAPCLCHVNIVNDDLIVTPLTKLGDLTAEDGEKVIEGNVLVEGDMLKGASIEASGSVFVAGRAVSCDIKAGNNILLCQGMRAEGRFASIEAKGHVWGLFFDAATIKAGGDVCANYLLNCEVTAGGRASILGGRAFVVSTNLYAQNGVVAGQLGDGRTSCTIAAGMDRAFIDRYTTVVEKVDRLNIDIQALQQSITAHERVNRRRDDKGRGDAAYLDLVKKRTKALSVFTILDGERTRLRRSLDQFSTVTIIAKDVVHPKVTIEIDTRVLPVNKTLQRTKFKRTGEVIDMVFIQNK